MLKQNFYLVLKKKNLYVTGVKSKNALLKIIAQRIKATFSNSAKLYYI